MQPQPVGISFRQSVSRYVSPINNPKFVFQNGVVGYDGEVATSDFDVFYASAIINLSLDQEFQDDDSNVPPIDEREADSSVVLSDLRNRVQNGDSEAEDILYQRYAIRLVSLAASRISKAFNSKIGPDDILQSVFKSFFIRHREDKLSFKNWNELWSFLASRFANAARKCDGIKPKKEMLPKNCKTTYPKIKTKSLIASPQNPLRCNCLFLRNHCRNSLDSPVLGGILICRPVFSERTCWFFVTSLCLRCDGR